MSRHLLKFGFSFPTVRTDLLYGKPQAAVSLQGSVSVGTSDWGMHRAEVFVN